MTIRELIDALKQFPEDMSVLTDGYENGYEEILYPEVIVVKHEPENTYYDGEYQIAGKKDGSSIKAVAIFRNKRDD
ncbi:MAG: hypothetical protein NTX06_06175 [Proteobacteria bacterium]|nr:hypothetical protein [Pseudomonadota bacterium]